MAHSYVMNFCLCIAKYFLNILKHTTNFLKQNIWYNLDGFWDEFTLPVETVTSKVLLQINKIVYGLEYQTL